VGGAADFEQAIQTLHIALRIDFSERIVSENARKSAEKRHGAHARRGSIVFRHIHAEAGWEVSGNIDKVAVWEERNVLR
jgi:hypothetical protein